MASRSISNPRYLEEGVGSWRTSFELNSTNSKDEDLDAGTGTVIVSATHSIGICPRSRRQESSCDGPTGYHCGGNEAGANGPLRRHEHFTALDFVLESGEQYGNSPHAEGEEGSHSDNDAIPSAFIVGLSATIQPREPLRQAYLVATEE